MFSPTCPAGVTRHIRAELVDTPARSIPHPGGTNLDDPEFAVFRPPLGTTRTVPNRAEVRVVHQCHERIRHETPERHLAMRPQFPQRMSALSWMQGTGVSRVQQYRRHAPPTTHVWEPSRGSTATWQRKHHSMPLRVPSVRIQGRHLWRPIRQRARRFMASPTRRFATGAHGDLQCPTLFVRLGCQGRWGRGP